MSKRNFSNFTLFLVLIFAVLFMGAAAFLAFLIVPARLLWPD